MTEEMQSQLLDFSAGDERAGFRLHRFEVYNWGTFHHRVWTLTPGGVNSLLTGDIGSGKSTLVDALTTLLVPAQRITYNKAAGADTKERSLRSYVLGYYKSERGDSGLSAKPVALRDHNSYSVVLGHFHNEGYGQDVTLAQVFWSKDTQGQPERFYVIGDGLLAIARDFAGFGSDLNALRKRLRQQPHVELFNHFPPYAAAFRRRFGIDNEQALELFNQTVSMKSVGNLTDFVRGHMLEPFPVEERIEALIRHFEDLDRAHQAVLKAKRQIAALEPLVADVERHGEVASEAERLKRCREALRPWFASRKAELLRQRLERLDRDLEALESRIGQLRERRTHQLGERDDLKRAIAENGGDRLERLKSEIADLGNRQQERRRRADDYERLLSPLELAPALGEAGFRENQRAVEEMGDGLEQERADAQNVLTEATVAFREVKRQHEEVEKELASLRRRRSNIPAAMLALREHLCDATGLSADSFPFAGELIQVRAEERDWEGAAERLLRSFGLSLLAPDAHYRTVAQWVDRTHLRGRLVYYRVRDIRDTGMPELHPDSLVRKLAIRPESAFYPWLEQELARRFDYACCAEVAQLRRERKAITRAGQIKAAGERHEKDDRYPIDDRSRYVLGWSNEAKIRTLEERAADLARHGQTLGQKIADAEATQKRLQDRADLLSRIQVYQDFRELDWRPLTLQIQRLEEERQALAEASDRLRTLQQQLEALDGKIGQTDEALTAARDECSRKQERHEQAARQRDEESALLEATPEEVRTQYFPQLETMRKEALGDKRLTVESCDSSEREMRDWLQTRIDAEDKRLRRLGERIVDAMRRYQSDWPLDTREVDVSIDAGEEYRQMLEQLRADDLPRFEARFRELLKENTIREVAAFQGRLNRERELIHERIGTINRSLHEIDYNPNRYIELRAEPTPDPEVREFRERLRACTEGTITGDGEEQYSESKFLQVQNIIERFRGRDGLSELDRRWSRKVTDVRNWFVFSASERWREDDTEYEHYSDSGGKSGGQKEKLAYTVLAASLAYQFGLEWGAQRSRSFRFVVIDEAFGRGSDESTRYGLDLFQRLNLQLLIVTPLQKIHIIEPYVASVAYVHNEGGHESMVRNLSIEEYRAERAARKLVQVS